MNRVTIYLYRNLNYRKRSFSKSMFFLSRISFVSILLLWLSSILTYLDRKLFDKKLLDFMNEGGVFVSCIAFVIGMYIIMDKYFVSIEKAEETIADPNSLDYINRTKWIFWVLILIPMLIILAAGKKY